MILLVIQQSYCLIQLSLALVLGFQPKNIQMHQKNELQTKPVVFNHQRQVFVNFLIKESIPSDNWQKVSLSEFDEPIKYVEENQAKGKAMFCRVNFKKQALLFPDY